MADTENKDLENIILMELKDGTVTIELLPDVAPLHCARMKDLVRSGQYDNVAFHRVIDGFMAQTGDVEHGNMEDNFNLRAAGTGGSKLPNLRAEFSKLPMTVAPSARPGHKTQIRPIASFSSTFPTITFSMVSTPSMVASHLAWSMWMPSPTVSQRRIPIV